MANIELSYETLEPGDSGALSVFRFDIQEKISRPFRIALQARSPNRGLDLKAIVGRRASLVATPSESGVVTLTRIVAPRAWSGVCSSLELVHVDDAKGQVIYALEIVPHLSRLAYVKSCRVFQNKTIPDIVALVLEANGVDAKWELGALYRKLEFRVQYNETDLDFVQRLLEEAGISYYFADDGASTLVMSDLPHQNAPRPSIRNEDNAFGVIDRDFVTDVRLSQRLATGAVSLRDYDFRRPNFRPTVNAPSSRSADFDMEQYRYAPGYGTVETPQERSSTPVADDGGIFRSDPIFARQRADMEVDAIRSERVAVRFLTNQVALAPGVVFSIANHPHPDFGEAHPLLVTESELVGELNGEWSHRCSAAFTDVPHRPTRSVTKARISGLQTAVVVGSAHEEIHVDERGRVRVQFHWVREGSFGMLDAHSSCWVRVSQTWAGAGYGSMQIPRVGQEVIVGFLDGDPDQPLVVGRLYNETEPVPYPLPENKTVSAWKSRSSPNSEGFNEIKFEDKTGSELVYVQAERNLTKLVKVDEAIRVGHDRAAGIGSVDSVFVGLKHEVTVAQLADSSSTPDPTRFTMVDKKITLTTGEATIELDGPNIKLMAKGNILLSAGGGIAMSSHGNDKPPGPAPTPAGGDVNITSLKNLNIGAVGDIAIGAHGNLMVAAVGTATFGSSGADALLSSAATTTVVGGPLVEINPGGALFAGRLTEQAPGTITTGSATVLIGGPSFYMPVVEQPDGSLKVGDYIFIKPGLRDGDFQAKTLRKLGLISTTESGRQRLDNIQNNPGGHNVTLHEFSAEDEAKCPDAPYLASNSTDGNAVPEEQGELRAGKGADSDIAINHDGGESIGPDEKPLPEGTDTFNALGSGERQVNGVSPGARGNQPTDNQWGTEGEWEDIDGGGKGQTILPHDANSSAPPESPSQNDFLADRNYPWRRTDNGAGFATPDGKQVTDYDGNPVPPATS